MKQAKVFRIFVSSTFRDFKQERDILQQKIYPALREYCTQHQATFQAVDLRWGISQEAGQERRTLNICLNEIRRCQQVTKSPNFLLLSGDRYGWRPLPVTIPLVEWNAIMPHVSSENQQLVTRWYKRDDNAVPPEYVLQPNYGVDNWWDTNDSIGIETQLNKILFDAVQHTVLSEQQRIKYETSATEQEIHEGIFNNPNANDETIVFVRNIENLPTDSNIYYEDDDYAQAQIANLRDKLTAYNPHYLTANFDGKQLDEAYIEAFGQQVYEAIKAKIDAELSSQEDLTALQIEQRQQEAFLRNRSQHFTGRDDVLQKIEHYINGDSNQPYIVHGQSGIGKTSIIAQAVKQHPDVIYRFIGATANSSNIFQLLTSICAEINTRTGQEADIPYDYDDLVDVIPQFLDQASQSPTLIILDAVDQLSEFNYPANLRWLPNELPNNVKIIISTIPGAYLREFRSRLPTQNLCTVHPMDYETASDLLDAWLAGSHRTLQSNQRNEVLTKFEHNALPLYLKLAFEEAKLWYSYTTEFTLATEVQSLLRDNLFARLGHPSEHGEALIQYSMAYLSAARYGLAENEILDLLALNDDYWNVFLAGAHEDHKLFDRQIPIIIWSRFELDLDPYMVHKTVDNTTVIDFYHRQFSEAIDAIYLEPIRQITHQHLSNYYKKEPLTNLRKLSELIYQFANAKQYDNLRTLLLTFDFLQAKLNASDPNALINDCAYLPNDGTIQLVQSALDMSTHILSHSPEQLPVQLYARLISHDDADIQQLLASCQKHDEPNLFPQTQTFQPAGGALLRTLVGHTSGVNSVSLSGEFAVSASGSPYGGDNTLKVWNWQTGKLLRTLEGHTHIVNSVSLSGEFAVSASWDKLKVWNWQTGELLRTLEGHTSGVNSVSLWGEFAVSASDDNTLKVWNWQTGELLRTLEGHSGGVNSVSLWGEFAVSASDDNTLKVWNWKTGELLRTLVGHTSGVNSVSLSGEFAVSASGSPYGGDNTLKVWNWQTGKLLRTLEGHTSGVNSVSLWGEFAVSASWDKLKVWNWQTGKLLRTLEGHTHIVNSVSLWGEFAVSASDDETLKVWNWQRVDTASSQTGELLRTGHTSGVNSVSLSGEFAVSASHDKTLKVWNWQTGKLLRTLEGHTSGVNSVSLSGEFAVSASWDTLKVWNWQTGELLRTLEGHTKAVRSVSLSGEFAVSASDDETLKVWNWQRGELLRTLEVHTNWGKHISYVNSVSLSGEFAVSASGSRLDRDDNTLKVWNWQTGKLLRTLVGHTDYIWSVSLWGEFAVSASGDETLNVWHWKTGELLRTLEGHSGGVNSVSLWGEFAVSASVDHTLKVWNWHTGALLTTFYADAPLLSVAIAEGFAQVVAGDSAGNVHFLRPNAALRRAVGVAGG
jgi:WD40 repeat protein